MPKYHAVKVRREQRYEFNKALQPEQELGKKLWVTNWTEMHQYYYWTLQQAPPTEPEAWADWRTFNYLKQTLDVGFWSRQSQSELFHVCLWPVCYIASVWQIIKPDLLLMYSFLFILLLFVIIFLALESFKCVLCCIMISHSSTVTFFPNQISKLTLHITVCWSQKMSAISDFLLWF